MNRIERKSADILKRLGFLNVSPNPRELTMNSCMFNAGLDYPSEDLTIIINEEAGVVFHTLEDAVRSIISAASLASFIDGKEAGKAKK